jgi:hypothetical protein
MTYESDAADAQLLEDGDIARLLARYEDVIVGRCVARLRRHADAGWPARAAPTVDVYHRLEPRFASAIVVREQVEEPDKVDQLFESRPRKVARDGRTACLRGDGLVRGSG